MLYIGGLEMPFFVSKNLLCFVWSFKYDIFCVGDLKNEIFVKQEDRNIMCGIPIWSYFV